MELQQDRQGGIALQQQTIKQIDVTERFGGALLAMEADLDKSHRRTFLRCSASQPRTPNRSPSIAALVLPVTRTSSTKGRITGRRFSPESSSLARL